MHAARTYTHLNWHCRIDVIDLVDGSNNSDWYIEATGRRRSSGKA